MKKKHKPLRNTLKTVLFHAGAFVLWYLFFGFALFLGLQVKPMYGNIGVITALVILVAYVVYFAKN